MKATFVPLALVLALAPLSGSAADCPKATAVEKLSKNVAYKPVAPFDLKALTKAKATKSAFGLTVFVTNVDFEVKAAAARLDTSPVKGKGQVSLAITFMNASKPVVAGEYAVRANVWDPMNVRGDLGFGKDDGTPVVYGLGLKSGKATLVEVTDARVCGTFDVVGRDGPFKGSFVATIVK
jgi:hypothetical protein